MNFVKNMSIGLLSFVFFTQTSCKKQDILGKHDFNDLSEAKTFPNTNRNFAPVLMYHAVMKQDSASASDQAGADILFEDFRKQMQCLKIWGYETVSISEYVKRAFEAPSSKTKPILLTFDDGYLNNFDNVYTYLLEKQMKAAFFVHTSLIGTGRPFTRNHMCKENLQVLNATPGFEMGSHTRTHPKFKDRIYSADLNGKRFGDYLNDDAVWEEVAGSKEALTKAFSLKGEKVTVEIPKKCQVEGGKATMTALRPNNNAPMSLAYPFGQYDEFSLCATIAAGYQAAFAINPKKYAPDPYDSNSWMKPNCLALADRITTKKYRVAYKNYWENVGNKKPDFRMYQIPRLEMSWSNMKIPEFKRALEDFTGHSLPACPL